MKNCDDFFNEVNLLRQLHLLYSHIFEVVPGCPTPLPRKCTMQLAFSLSSHTGLVSDHHRNILYKTGDWNKQLLCPKPSIARLHDSCCYHKSYIMTTNCVGSIRAHVDSIFVDAANVIRHTVSRCQSSDPDVIAPKGQ